MMSAIWNLRLPDVRSRWLHVFGVLAALLIVLAVPSQFLNDVPFWRLTGTGPTQALACAAAYLATVAFIAAPAGPERRMRLVHAVFIPVLCFGAVFLCLSTVRRDLLYAEGDFLVSAALGSAMAIALPFALAWFRAWVLVPLVLALGVLGFLGSRDTIAGLPKTTVSTTAIQLMSVTRYPALIPPPRSGRGGGLEAYRDGFVLATPDGDFFELAWDRDALTAKKLPFVLPADPDVTDAEREYLRGIRVLDRRVTDILLDAKAVPPALYVASEQWNVKGRCFELRVSRASVDLEPALNAHDWAPFYTTTPCLAPGEGFGWLEAGGRLQKRGDRVLLAIGDFNQSSTKRPPPSQDLASVFGKVWSIDAGGHAELFTLGHRNPQGLLVDGDGRVWETEHGPQGGDELNLLEQGSNYGYPLVTYGADYGRFVWSVAPSTHDHGQFHEPVHAFTPWVGISNLIRIEGDTFPAWRHDLLLGSLNGSSLFRIRLRDERAIYTEQIPLGERIRDIAESTSGRIAIWTDASKVLTLTAGPAKADGAVVFARCRSCHDSPDSSATEVSLKGVVGRKVASVPGYQYSPSLTQLGGVWSADRLDKFLADPEAFAPGTAMGPGQVPDAAERRALVQFLGSYK